MRKNKARRPGAPRYTTRAFKAEITISAAPKGIRNVPDREVGKHGTQQAKMPDFSKVGQNGHRHFG